MYQRTPKLLKFLMKIDDGDEEHESISGFLLHLSYSAVNAGLWSSSNHELVKGWIGDLKNIGYEF
jgi:hypothetical protein